MRVTKVSNVGITRDYAKGKLINLKTLEHIPTEQHISKRIIENYNSFYELFSIFKKNKRNEYTDAFDKIIKGFVMPYRGMQVNNLNYDLGRINISAEPVDKFLDRCENKYGNYLKKCLVSYNCYVKNNKILLLKFDINKEAEAKSFFNLINTRCNKNMYERQRLLHRIC